MRDGKDICISINTSIAEAVKVIDEGKLGIALVVDGGRRLLGIVTDVDVRKGLLRGISLDGAVKNIVTREAIIAKINEPRDEILNKMRRKSIRQIPVVDDSGVVVGVEFIGDFYIEEKKVNNVVVLAGGFGKRLMPLTKDKPKALLEIGDRPILEIILHNLSKYGFNNIFLIVNYLSEQIEEFLHKKDNVMNIRFIREEKPLGTCGALGLLPENEFDKPFFVINADLLTNVNFTQLLDFHIFSNRIATVCIKEYKFQVPYGVIEMDGYIVNKIVEKPAYSTFVNAGIYVFNPTVFKYIPKCYLDMTDLLKTMLNAGEKISCFPIREFWMDIGEREDYERAHDEYRKNFEYD